MARRPSNIRQRGDSYLVHIRVNGSRVWKSLQTKDEAQLFLARQMELRARGMQPERRVRVTFREAAEGWYRDRGTGEELEPVHAQGLRSALDVHLLPAFGDLPSEKITRGTD